jgi:hypothetical protein
MNDGRLFLDSGVVSVCSCLLHPADQGNIPGEVGTFAFELSDRGAISGAFAARKSVQLELNESLRADIVITDIRKSFNQSRAEFVADFSVNTYIE